MPPLDSCDASTSATKRTPLNELSRAQFFIVSASSVRSQVLPRAFSTKFVLVQPDARKTKAAAPTRTIRRCARRLSADSLPRSDLDHDCGRKAPFAWLNDAPGRIRTPDQRLRRPPLFH